MMFALVCVVVTDRLAFFQFVHGSLAGTLSKRVDATRVPLKTLRGAESTLAVRHNVRAGYDRELAKLEVDRPRGHEKRRADLESALKKAEDEDEPLEKEVELLSRKAIRESERAKWDAIREVRYLLLSLGFFIELMFVRLSTGRNLFYSLKLRLLSLMRCLRSLLRRTTDMQVKRRLQLLGLGYSAPLIITKREPWIFLSVILMSILVDQTLAASV